jgi:phosphatidylglycerol lysyltransferase
MNDQKALSSQDFAKKADEESSLLAEARRLVLAYGWNTTSYQILNPGINLWFSRANDAVVGFAQCRNRRVVVGAPVCAENRLAEVAAEFEQDTAKRKARVCYFCAESRLESIYKNSPTHAKVLLGAQPVWQPCDWAEIIAKNKSLRAQLNRARNKGVTVAEWSIEKAQNNPVLFDCIRQWLDAKGLPPLHFMVETDTLNRLFDRRVFVAERPGEVLGFVLLSPVTQRKGWLFEQFVHKPGAPNGTVELMIDAAMRALAANGDEYATLGLAPLSTRARVAPFDNPLWLRILLAWMRVHARRFYNFDGLDAFKAKLKPERWEPVFAVSNEKNLSPKTLYAIASAFSQNAPFKLVAGGLSRALMTEISWLKRSVNK